MRIISKKHDYYDVIMKHGFDPSIVFERKSVVYEDVKKFDKDLEEYLLPIFELIRGYRRCIEPFAVIFCGKIYFGIRITVKTKCNWYDSYNSSISVYCYNAEETIKVLNKNNNDIDVKRELSGKILVNGKFINVTPERRVKVFFENNGSDKFINLMIAKKCPILSIEDANSCKAMLKCEVNPILKNLAFFRVLDPYTAYQNLSMFVGGIITKEDKPTVEISDEDMAIKKGFDKWSFRKMKGD